MITGYDHLNYTQKLVKQRKVIFTWTIFIESEKNAKFFWLFDRKNVNICHNIRLSPITNRNAALPVNYLVIFRFGIKFQSNPVHSRNISLIRTKIASFLHLMNGIFHFGRRTLHSSIKSHIQVWKMCVLVYVIQQHVKMIKSANICKHSAQCWKGVNPKLKRKNDVCLTHLLALIISYQLI